jgi:arsenate reductase-like glutaredoxin family protein
LKKCRTINKNKEIIINNNITFKEEVFSYDYPKEMLQDFYDYWTEPSKRGKLRKDMQKTWCTERRLKTWAKRSKQYDNKTSKIDSQLNEYLKGKELL